MAARDHIGKRFGRWTVIKLVGAYIWKNQKFPTALCRCACGTEKILKLSGLRYNAKRSVSSCGCYAREMHQGKDGRDSAFKTIFNGYKYGAKDRGIPFLLSYDNFCHLIQQNCAYCGTPPNTTRVIPRKLLKSTITYNGLDRIDNTGPYAVLNVKTACSICNRAKGTLTLPEFQAWLSRVRGHQAKGPKPKARLR